MSRSKTKYCVLHNGMIPGILKVNVSFSASEQGTKFLSVNILVNIDSRCYFDYISFFTCIYSFSIVIIVLGFKY